VAELEARLAETAALAEARHGDLARALDVPAADLATNQRDHGRRDPEKEAAELALAELRAQLADKDAQIAQMMEAGSMRGDGSSLSRTGSASRRKIDTRWGGGR
jgi:hypothetical protein